MIPKIWLSIDEEAKKNKRPIIELEEEVAAKER
jgi:hypothetical protein